MATVIGRTDEADAIARFARQVAHGPVALLIEGEPGIGKTTLWLEAVHRAREGGCLVLTARPAESESELSFAALGDLVGGLLDDVGDSLPPPQRVALQVALLRRDADGPVDPRTAATGLASVLAMAAARQPLVIAVDDAQWLDPATRRALEFAARRLPDRSGVLLSARSGDGSARWLGLDRELGPDRLRHLRLGPLAPDDLYRIVETRLGIRTPRPLLARVAEASRGNAFAALEISAAIARHGATPAIGDPLPVPTSLRDLLGDRIDRLSSQALAAAAAVAALSRPTVAGVSEAIGPDVSAEAALLEAEEAGVLVTEGDRIRFSHPLLATAIYGSLAGSRRRSLHRRLAAVVADPEEAARHLSRSATGADEAFAATIEEAAGLADRRGAPEAAAELYEAARRLTPEGHAEDHARRTIGGANALSRAGDLGGAQRLAMSALETAPTGPLRARALFLLGMLATYTATLDERAAYHERALAEVGDDEALRVELLLAMFEEIASDPARAVGRASELIELLRSRGDRPRLAHALAQQFAGQVVLGRGANLALLDEALALGTRSWYPLLWFHWIDDLEGVRAQHALRDQEARDAGDTVRAAELVEFRAITEFRAGNWDLAERALEEACSTLGQVGLRGPQTASFADRSVIDAHRGRLARARTTLVEILEGVDRLEGLWRMTSLAALGVVEFCAGEHAAADRAWTAMRAEADRVGWVDVMEDRSEPDHVEALLALGRPDDARLVLDHLEWRGRTVPRPWIDAGLPRARALLLVAEGDLDAALDALDAAPEVPGLPFERARLLLVRGQIERRANRRRAARDSLGQALAILESLGSPPWADRTRREIARLGLRHRGRDELTEGERRIAELAASGLTNRQVAEAAFVSPKTVEANLARVYAKLGIRSRAELGSRMPASEGDGATNT